MLGPRQKDFSIWIASKKMPTEWREREDIEWWTNALAKTYEREMQELACFSKKPTSESATPAPTDV